MKPTSANMNIDTGEKTWLTPPPTNTPAPAAARTMPLRTITCALCGRDIETRSPNGRYCQPCTDAVRRARQRLRTRVLAGLPQADAKARFDAELADAAVRNRDLNDVGATISERRCKCCRRPFRSAFNDFCPECRKNRYDEIFRVLGRAPTGIKIFSTTIPKGNPK